MERDSGISMSSISAALRLTKRSMLNVLDYELEHALATILRDMATHAEDHGIPRLWVALPFLSTGGAELVALNLCRAVRELRPEQSLILLITDKNLVSDRVQLPPGVFMVVFDHYFAKPLTYERKQALLRNLLVAGQPHAFHNINSEVAWNLVLADGERLRRYTRLYASIFAFQFAPDNSTKIGYAAYFLKKSIPHLAGLFSDNQRFLTDAARDYALSHSESARMCLLYQPCRLLSDEHRGTNVQHIQERQRRLQSLNKKPENRRPQILWAGRLDGEKRLDLFLEVVRHCSFADFRVYGQLVVNDHCSLPTLPNLSYEGPFSSPLEWLDRYDFDAFIFTSKWEGMPNILLEVGTLGIPIIAPTVGGVVELIDNTTGYPLPERPTVAEYKQALLQATSLPAQALKRAKKLYDLIQKRHGWSKFIADVSSLPHYLYPLSELSSRATNIVDRDEPVVSVIVPCFNQGHYLLQALTSALSSCSSSLEIIVIDDGSTDPSIERQLTNAKQLAPDAVHIHRQTNHGLSWARNNGLSLAKGKYVQFLDADDLLTPGKIDAQIAQLEINPDLDISVCNYVLCDETCRIFTKTEEAIAHFEISARNFLYKWERGFVIPIHAGLFRRSALKEHRFDTNASAKEDWLFWTFLSMAGTRFSYLNGHWAIYRQHALSMRRSYVKMGRAWLEAGLKINEKVAHRDPLFLESVLSWFEQYYHSHPSYRAEIAGLQNNQTLTIESATTYTSVAEQARQASDAILSALSSLPPLMESPKISVVVPIYNHFEYLKACLSSLAEQGAVPFEIVCIDDGSSDARVSLLMDALSGRNPRLRVHKEPNNRGISFVQNFAVEMARSEYVAFLDCDDALEPSALETVLATLQAKPEIDYLFSDRVDIDEHDGTIRIARYGGYDHLKFQSQAQITDDLFDGMVASHLKVIRRSVYIAIGGCAPNYSGVQDWELALRIAQKHELYYLNQALYRHRIHTRSVTQSNNVAQLHNTNAILRQHLERWRTSSIMPPSVHVFGLQDFPISLKHLKDIWKQGGSCIADLRGNVSIEHINFMRGFNAYFDQITWSQPNVPASLYGYLWDRHLLVQSSGNAIPPLSQ